MTVLNDLKAHAKVCSDPPCLLHELGFKGHTRAVLMPVVISNGLRAAAPPQPQSAACSLHACSYIQQSGRSVKSTNAKNTREKSAIHENADANITCDFGDGNISCFLSRLPHTRSHGHTHGHVVSSIIVRLVWPLAVWLF